MTRRNLFTLVAVLEALGEVQQLDKTFKINDLSNLDRNQSASPHYKSKIRYPQRIHKDGQRTYELKRREYSKR